MHYHKPTATIRPLPRNGKTAAGVAISNLCDRSGNQLQPDLVCADCGYYRVVSDTPAQPPDTTEDVAKRVVTLDEATGTCTVVRTWVAVPDPENAELERVASSAALGDFANVVAWLGLVQASGVSLPQTMTISGIFDAIDNSSLDALEKLSLKIDGNKLWGEVLYHYNGQMQDAYADLPRAITIIQSMQ